jgi:hypothetical protein
MTESEVFDDLRFVARQTVSIFRTVRDEVENQFPELSPEERHKVFLMIFPFVADLFAMGARGALLGEEPEPSGKSKRKR